MQGMAAAGPLPGNRSDILVEPGPVSPVMVGSSKGGYSFYAGESISADRVDEMQGEFR